jgi:hypothetical protein
MHSSNPMGSRSSFGFTSTSVKFDNNNTSPHSDGMDRRYKIRLVERLTSVRTAVATSDQNSFMKGTLGSGGSVNLNHSLGGMNNSLGGTMMSLGASIQGGGGLYLDNASMREAVEKAELNSVELLNFSDHELKAVVEEQIVKLVQDLIKRATLDSDIRSEINALDTAGYNLLHYSCLYNQVALLPILLMRGARVNTKTGSGSTALHLASQAGHMAAVELLVESRADVDAEDENGNTAVTLANMNGHNDIAAFLESVRIIADYQFYLF